MTNQEEQYVKAFSNRREFMGGCAALGTTSILSSILQLQMTNSAFAALPTPSSDYRALVCVFLFGGNDSYNMLVPFDNDQFSRYRETRGDLALSSRSDLIRLNGGGRAFGVNSNMPGVADMYNDGDLSFLANVGTLVEPVADVGAFESGARLPRALFSHNDQQQIWQTSLADRQSRTGWAGRIGDILNDSINRNSSISMNISLAGTNILQSGNNLVPYVSSPDGAIPLNGYRPNSLLLRGTNSVLDQSYQNIFKQQFADVRKDALEAATEYGNRVSGARTRRRFPNSSIGNQLREVAQAIASRGSSGGFETPRQTFFVTMGGFDTHADLGTTQPGLLSQLSEALSAFNEEMKAIGAHDQVLTYTASDFGRSLTSNGRGSDHAWGGNQLVMGGPVVGGRIHGNYPTYERGGSVRGSGGRNIDVGRGRLIPEMAVDSLHAELARWFGIPNDNRLEQVLPNIRSFFSSKSDTDLPVGFVRRNTLSS